MSNTNYVRDGRHLMNPSRAAAPVTSESPSEHPTPSLPPDSPAVEPWSSRFTVLGLIVVVEHEGERLSLHFEGQDVEAIRPDEWMDRTVIGVDSIRVAETLDWR